MWPTVISDYEGLSEAAWSTGSFFSYAWHKNSSPFTWEFGGEEYNTLYHMLEVPPSADEVTSVIMEPLRFTIDDPASNGGNYDYWTDGNGDLFIPDCVSPTFLPASGHSHISAGLPGRITCDFVPNSCMQHVWYQLTSWGKTTLVYIEDDPVPAQFQVYLRFAQMRVNGEAVGPLYDRQDLQRSIQTFGGMRRFEAQSIIFPSDPAWYIVRDFLPEYGFRFEAGDLIEIDAWFELEAVPQATLKYVFAVFSQGVTTNGSRTPSTTRISWAHSGSALQQFSFGNHYYMSLTNLEASRGFDPERHTYYFDPVGGWSLLGKAQSDLPPQVWDITITGTPTDGSFTITIEGDTISAQDVTGNHDATGSQIQSGIRAMTGTGLSRTTVDKTSETGVSRYRLTFHGTEERINVTVENNLDTGTIDVDEVAEWLDPDTATATFIVTQSSLSWGFPITRPDDLSDDRWRSTIYLTWGTKEIAEIQFSVSRSFGGILNEARTVFYRPASNGDYVTEVSDRYDGALTRGPCGSFLHLGQTVFERYDPTVMAPPFVAVDPGGLWVGAFPSEITVTKVSQ